MATKLEISIDRAIYENRSKIQKVFGESNVTFEHGDVIVSVSLIITTQRLMLYLPIARALARHHH